MASGVWISLWIVSFVTLHPVSFIRQDKTYKTGRGKTYFNFPSTPLATVLKCSALAFVALASAPCFALSSSSTVRSNICPRIATTSAAVTAISLRAAGNSANCISLSLLTLSPSCFERRGMAFNLDRDWRARKRVRDGSAGGGRGVGFDVPTFAIFRRLVTLDVRRSDKGGIIAGIMV